MVRQIKAAFLHKCYPNRQTSRSKYAAETLLWPIQTRSAVKSCKVSSRRIREENETKQPTRQHVACLRARLYGLRKNAATARNREGHDLGRAAKALKIGLRFSAGGSPLPGGNTFPAASLATPLRPRKNAALAAEVPVLTSKRLFPQPASKVPFLRGSLLLAQLRCHAARSFLIHHPHPRMFRSQD